MKNYIVESESKIDKSKISNEIFSLKSKYYEKDPFDVPVNMDRVFTKIATKIPSHFLNYVDTIIVGRFDFLEDKDFDALYRDGGIYLSSLDKENESDVVDDIIHEIAHAVEENNQHLIYGDNEIEREFLAKRRKLYFLLKENGFRDEVDFYDFENVEYEEQFDIFLYQEVSYALLSNLTSDVFCSPYGATSLREYFANAFEHYFYSSNPQLVKQVSRSVYRKITELLNNEN